MGSEQTPESMLVSEFHTAHMAMPIWIVCDGYDVVLCGYI